MSAKKKNKAAPKRAKSKKAVNKSAFIREHPHKTAKEVIALAKAQNVDLTASHIYVVRTKENKSKGGGSSTGRGRTAKASRAGSGDLRGGLSADEKGLLRLARKVGIDRAMSLLDVAGEFLAALA